MAFTFLFISCSPDQVIISPSDNYQLAVNNFENELGLYNSMELVRSVAVANNVQSPEELLSFFTGIEPSDRIGQLVNVMQEETAKFNEIGYESYVQEKASLGNLSANMEKWLLDYKEIVLSFLDTRPSEDEFMVYFDQTDNFYNVDEFSQDEAALITKTLNDAKEYAKYYYLHYSMDNDDGVDFRERDCNFWKGLGCGLFYVAIVVIVIAVIYAALFALVSAILATGGTILIAGTQVTVASAGAQAIEALLILMLEEKIKDWTASFFDWCCGLKEEKICAAPIGAHIQKLGCNSFRYTIFGPGNYSTTTWSNTNIVPMAAVTPTPSFLVSVPTMGTPSTFGASILCTELPSGNINTFSWVEVVTLLSDSAFSLNWLFAPPNEISWQEIEFGEEEGAIEASVTPINESLYDFEWEVIGQATIESHGADAFIFIEGTGEITTNITVTNKCTGESQSLTKTTNITE